MANESKSTDLMEKLVALCKRRGFIFQSSEIYGGINGFWDYGPLGVELKRNVKDAWWQDVVTRRDDIVGLDCSIIMNPKVWEASGHVVNFNDPLVDCKKCKARFRADQFWRYELMECPRIPDPQEDVANVLRQFSSQGKLSSTDKVFLAEPGMDLQARVRQVPGLKRAKVEILKLATMGPDAAFAFVRDGDRTFYADAKLTTARVGDHCPICDGELTEPRKFNMMFKTSVGAMEDSASVVHLRPETAQGIFCNYKNVLDTSRMKVPFGIAQIGKSFRNEINPRNYTFRSREFEQMEIEFFCHPSQADKWYEYWRDARFQWYVGLGLRSSRLRLRNHEKEELAHYARACADIEYEFPFGISELEGVANRTDFDLSQHQKFSGKDMTFFDDETKERYIPHVIEPSGGVDRAVLAFLCEAYSEDQAPDENGVMQSRTVMRFHPRLAPVKVAVFPLVKKDGMPEIAQAIHRECKQAALASFYDEKGAVGRRYRRQDEAGTPFCVTVDGQTLQDRTVTIRDRDTLKQERVAAAGVVEYVRAKLKL